MRDREPRLVRERILDRVAGQQFRTGDFAIVAPTNEICRQYRNDLLTHSIPCAYHRDLDFALLDERVKVLTIHSAKGLELPMVFVVGLHPGELPFRAPSGPGADEWEVVEYERQRTLLYLAMTPAAEALLVTSVGGRSPLLSEVAGKVKVEEAGAL